MPNDRRALFIVPPPPQKVGVAVLSIPVPCALCLVGIGHEDVSTLMLAAPTRLEAYFLNRRVPVLDESCSVPSTSSHGIVQHTRTSGSTRIYLDPHVHVHAYLYRLYVHSTVAQWLLFCCLVFLLLESTPPGLLIIIAH